MRNAILLTVVACTMVGLYSIEATSAAAEDGSPAVLCLVTGCTALEVKATGGTTFTETLSATGVEAERILATVKGCEEVGGSGGKDLSLCKDVSLTLEGERVKGSTSKCNTEGDPAGIVLTLVDLHLAALETTTKELEPLGLGKVLNMKLEPEQAMLCASGLIKVVARGTMGCAVSPGLVNVATTEQLEVRCRVNTTTHDQELDGKCVSLCEWLKEPFELNLGAGFLDASKQFTMSGKPSKDIFIDD